MLFLCCVIYKYDALTASDDLQDKMSLEQVSVAKAIHDVTRPYLTVCVVLVEGELHHTRLGALSASSPQRVELAPRYGRFGRRADGYGRQARRKFAPTQVRCNGPLGGV